MTSAAITPAIVEEHGLKPGEYRSIVERLGREPNITELGIYSVMWSEHCAYKHSRTTLRLLPTRGPRVVVGPGENAGAIDIGDGLCVVFKMESHNHPSAVEPFQGAATGVGGILRDIFTMGARPIAMLDNLRFGNPRQPAMQDLIEGVIEGIAGYGNCVGVPTVAGDAMFDDGHAGNILVNAMCVGIARSDALLLAKAEGPGNKVLYFGSATGRDGIHGATFASEELSEEALERRGAVQVGDPFMGKKILEATLELIARGLVRGMQDMGAAGLTCSTCETASRAGNGMDVDLDRVPQRARGMNAYEIMLSESQERMLAIVEPGNVEAALEVCRRWECGGAVIGEVTGEGRLIVRHHGAVVADLPADHLTNNGPLYDPALVEPPPPGPAPDAPSLDAAALRAAALRVLSSPNTASKRWIWERYDHQVQANTVVRPGDAGAAVLRVRGEGAIPDKFLALASGGNHRFVAMDPRRGGALAIAEVARALSCVGAEPLGVTNCLNFGSPERPEVFGYLRRAVEGMAEACRALGTPVTGGNVSLYNEHDGVAIPPTPMIGMVGQLSSAAGVMLPAFREAGHAIVVVGRAATHIGGSEFDRVVLGASRGRGPVDFDLAEDAALQGALREAIAGGLVRSAHGVALGGLLVALAECLLLSRDGLGVRLDAAHADAVALFGELPPRVVLTARPGDVAAIGDLFRGVGVPVVVAGSVTAEDALEVGAGFRITRGELRRAHETHPFEETP